MINLSNLLSPYLTAIFELTKINIARLQNQYCQHQNGELAIVQCWPHHLGSSSRFQPVSQAPIPHYHLGFPSPAQLSVHPLSSMHAIRCSVISPTLQVAQIQSVQFLSTALLSLVLQISCSLNLLSVLLSVLSSVYMKAQESFLEMRI